MGCLLLIFAFKKANRLKQDEQTFSQNRPRTKGRNKKKRKIRFLQPEISEYELCFRSGDFLSFDGVIPPNELDGVTK